MQDIFPERNREVFNNEYGRHFFDVLADNGTIIEFQHSPIGLEDFAFRTDAYTEYALVHSAPRPIWIFDYAGRNFFVESRGKFSPRNRKLKWYRPSQIFGEYRSKTAKYELWFRVNPLKYKPEFSIVNGVIRGATYGAVTSSVGYLKVKGIYGDNLSLVYGDAYTESEFISYLKSFQQEEIND